MEFYSLNLKQFKNLFFAALCINAIVTLGAYIGGAHVLGIVLVKENALSQAAPANKVSL